MIYQYNTIKSRIIRPHTQTTRISSFGLQGKKTEKNQSLSSPLRQMKIIRRPTLLGETAPTYEREVQLFQFLVV